MSEPEAPAAAAAPAAEATPEAEAAPEADDAPRFKPGPRPARPGAPRPGNNPFSSSQGMGTRPAPRPAAPGDDSVRRVRRPAATACRAPTPR